MKTRVWLILLVIIMTSCSSNRWLAKHPITQSHDSTNTTVTTVTKHDTVFKVKPDSSSLIALIECSGNVAKLQSIIAYTSGKTTVGIPITKFRHDTLYVECPPLDTLKLYATWYDKIVKQNINSNSNKTIVQYQQTKWQKIVGYLGYAFMGMLALVITYIALKLFSKLKLPI